MKKRAQTVMRLPLCAHRIQLGPIGWDNEDLSEFVLFPRHCSRLYCVGEHVGIEPVVS
jgi:hypothetical protein